MKTVRLDNQGIQVIINGLAKPIANSKEYFDSLTLRTMQKTSLVFRVLGRGGTLDGHSWKKLSQSTLKSKSGTWNIRYGTDLEGRPKGTYVPGKLRKGIRRYFGGSQILNAGGGFMKAFNSISITNKGMKFGLQGKWRDLGKKIMGVKDRQALWVSQADKKKWIKWYMDYYNRRQKF